MCMKRRKKKPLNDAVSGSSIQITWELFSYFYAAEQHEGWGIFKKEWREIKIIIYGQYLTKNSKQEGDLMKAGFGLEVRHLTNLMSIMYTYLKHVFNLHITDGC